ncbi:ANTAR domain-containing protein [Streptomyces sp. NPDC046821]|uniref:ANTAR domain-containing protein n=1 Tax=Streptomyces sp. NPDC046821 TaxID=3154702 RepID=UPI0033C68017
MPKREVPARIVTSDDAVPAEPGHDPGQSGDGAPQDPSTELAQLRRAMQTRPVIDLARGILMASYGLSADDAWQVLVSVSQNTNTKLHRVAGDLVDSVTGDPLPEQFQELLAATVAKVGKGVSG